MFKLFKENKDKKEIYDLSIEFLLEKIIDTFGKLLRESVYLSGYNKEELENRAKRKQELRNALRLCAFGDISSKKYVKSYIKDILIKNYNINQNNINNIIPFQNIKKLSSQDKFEIILYELKKQYKYKALEILITKYNLDKPKNNINGIYYEITNEDINNIFLKQNQLLISFNDKLEIITQRIYQMYKGNGVIDEIRDMEIDGISGGVSGIPESFNFEELNGYPHSYDSIWIFYKGKSIHLSFLSFKSERELIRVCKNIYKYNNPGQLSQVKGYTVNEMKDGSRVAVARPPFSETWVFFIRKFDSILKTDITKLITDKNNLLPIQIMKWLIKGCQVIGITGEQGSGKTTLLMSLIGFINPVYNIRVQELAFELHLRKTYPNRNIVTFRETNNISGQEGLDFQKKSDGAVSILGEVASNNVSSWLIQISQIASLFTLFTHHAKTTKDLVVSMRNALLTDGGFSNEKIAEQQVASVINFDIHMKKNVDGHRYIERITEIIPLENINNNQNLFQTIDIIVFQNDRYIYKNPISNKRLNMIFEALNSNEKQLFFKEQKLWEECI